MIESIQRAIETSEELRACLISNEEIGRRMIENLAADVPYASVVKASEGEPSKIRMRTNELLSRYEHCRHEMRVAFIGPILDEGMTVSEVGRSLGTSRQLAARLAKEARDESTRG